jgi:hypothetical protein
MLQKNNCLPEARGSMSLRNPGAQQRDGNPAADNRNIFQLSNGNSQTMCRE